MFGEGGIMNESNSLIIFTKAALMLAEADTIQKAKELKNLALTAADWAKRKGMGEQAIQHCRSYAMEAERKMGEMLKETERSGPKYSKGGGSKGSKREPLPEAPPTLADLGLTKRESSEAQMLADLPEAEFEEIKTGKKTKSKVIKEIKAEKRKSERAGLIVTMPSGKYAVILADPPWQYKNSGFNESAESQYQTMSTEDICAMAGIVNGFSTPETVIFMWATNPLLPDALKVMAAWGYEYKTNMAWIKDQGRGRGWFLKSKHELILIGTRANTPHPKERPDSCFEADRGPVHSRKPQAIYDIIESMYDGAKLEMFCREPHKGWASHGNEL